MSEQHKIAATATATATATRKTTIDDFTGALNLPNGHDGPTPPSLKRAGAGVIIGAILIAGGVAGYRHFHVMNESAAIEAELAAGPRVRFVHLSKSPSERSLNLVGEARPYSSVTLYAKVSGYLKEVKVDKGDQVKKGQLIAVIESPEVDKQYQGALADAKNKKAIAGRINTLKARDLVSAQEADQAESDYAISQARFESLELQKNYELLRAPFAGTVTARFADSGALVQNAMNSQASALPVVTISQLDHLRIYVYVDQRDAAFIQTGSPVKVTIAERQELELTAKISRISGELDAKTKMLLTEIDVDNKDGKIVSGSFVHVSLDVHTPTYLQIPVEALVEHDDRHLVATIDPSNHLSYREVKVGMNDGKLVTIVSGLKDDERVALNVGNTLTDGALVQPVDAAPATESKTNAKSVSAKEVR